MIFFFLLSLCIATYTYPADLEAPERSLATPKNKTVAASLGIQLGSGNINWLAPTTIVWLAQADGVNIKQRKWLIDWARNAGATQCTLEALKRLKPKIWEQRYQKIEPASNEPGEKVYARTYKRIQAHSYGRSRLWQRTQRSRPVPQQSFTDISEQTGKESRYPRITFRRGSKKR